MLAFAVVSPDFMLLPAKSIGSPWDCTSNEPVVTKLYVTLMPDQDSGTITSVLREPSSITQSSKTCSEFLSEAEKTNSQGIGTVSATVKPTTFLMLLLPSISA